MATASRPRLAAQAGSSWRTKCWWVRRRRVAARSQPGRCSSAAAARAGERLRARRRARRIAGASGRAQVRRTALTMLSNRC
eukprot:10522427-Alexandrium_andersonii.AAC.1